MQSVLFQGGGGHVSFIKSKNFIFFASSLWRRSRAVLYCSRFINGFLRCITFQSHLQAIEKYILNMQIQVQHIQLCLKLHIRFALHEVRWVFFKWPFGYVKLLPWFYPSRYVLAINETFKKRYCMNYYLKGHQNYNKSKSKVPKKAYFISKLG